MVSFMLDVFRIFDGWLSKMNLLEHLYVIRNLSLLLFFPHLQIQTGFRLRAQIILKWAWKVLYRIWIVIWTLLFWSNFINLRHSIFIGNVYLDVSYVYQFRQSILIIKFLWTWILPMFFRCWSFWTFGTDRGSTFVKFPILLDWWASKEIWILVAHDIAFWFEWSGRSTPFHFRRHSKFVFQCSMRTLLPQFEYFQHQMVIFILTLSFHKKFLFERFRSQMAIFLRLFHINLSLYVKQIVQMLFVIIVIAKENKSRSKQRWKKILTWKST